MTTTERSQAQFDIVYDGPAVADGVMDVRDLGPALMAVGSLFDAANLVANGERASVNVNVRATSHGSFEIVFDVVQSLRAQAADQSLITLALELKELLIGGGIGAGSGLVMLIRWLRGRRPKVDRLNDGLYRLTVDGDTYEVPLVLLRLYQDAATRRALADMLKPLREQGIETLEIRERGERLHQIHASDVVFYEAPEVQELLLDEVRRQAFSVVSLSFKEDNKWRLTDGHNTFSVSMKDEGFQRRVDTDQVGFFKNDILVCDLRTVQWQIRDGIKTEYEVVRVLSHRQARQLPLPLVDAGGEAIPPSTPDMGGSQPSGAE